MLFLNFGEEKRADQYYTQRLVQYHEAVAQYDTDVAGMKNPPAKVFNTKIKSFRILTRAKKDIQARSITEEAMGLPTKRDSASKALKNKLDQRESQKSLRQEQTKFIDQARDALKFLEENGTDNAAKQLKLMIQQAEKQPKLPLGPARESLRFLEKEQTEQAAKQLNLAIQKAERECGRVIKQIADIEKQVKEKQTILDGIVARMNAEPTNYHGILAVDLEAAKNQYGCVKRIYTPLLRDAIKGTYEERTPWRSYLPVKVVKWIGDNPIKYRCIRLIGFILKQGTQIDASLVSPTLAMRLESHLDPQSSFKLPLPFSQLTAKGVEQLEMRDVPVVGLRQCRLSKCGRTSTADEDHGQHFEYLVEFQDGKQQWHWSELIALDLREEFETLSREGAKEVHDIEKTNPDGTLVVHHNDGSTDTVDSSQLFWEEDVGPVDNQDFSNLTEKELEAILHITHHGVDHDVSTHALLEYKSDWAKVETLTPGTFFHKDPLFHDSIYDDVTIMETSVMWKWPHTQVFKAGAVP